MDFKPEWKAVDPPIDIRDLDFRNRKGLLERGNLLKIADGTEVEYILVGDVNVLGGVCDDCAGSGKIIAVSTSLTELLQGL